ncbi:GTP pyrophosphokinase [Aestuariimicrobium soli]|uniref:GTP pyrophosphokinase n=1 Tax=Aestuariimicrobium soli TaxID=2035834 RepID=UPI003EB8E5EC
MSEVVGGEGQLASAVGAVQEETDSVLAADGSAPPLRSLQVERACYEDIDVCLSELAVTAQAEMTARLEASGIKVHSVTARVKEFTSAYDKASAHGCAVRDLRDLVGVRVVCLYRADLQRVDSVIHDAFTVLYREDKREASPVDSFGYASIHYDCQLPYSRVPGMGNADNLAKWTFEVQARTILMDAWANVSHHLAYKGKSSMPAEVAREFHALSGLFHIADKALDGVFDAAERSRLRAIGGPSLSDPIDRDTLRGLLCSEYSDRRAASPGAYAALADGLVDAGYRSLNEVRSDLLAGKRGYGRWVSRYGSNDNFTDAAAARRTIAIANANSARVLYPGMPDVFSPYRQ